MGEDERRRAGLAILYRPLLLLAAVTGALVVISSSASSLSWVGSSTGPGWGWTVLMLAVPFLAVFLVWLAWASFRRIVAPPPCVCGHPWEDHGEHLFTVPCRDCTCWTYLATRRSQDAPSP